MSDDTITWAELVKIMFSQIKTMLAFWVPYAIVGGVFVTIYEVHIYPFFESSLAIAIKPQWISAVYILAGVVVFIMLFGSVFDHD